MNVVIRPATAEDAAPFARLNQSFNDVEPDQERVHAILRQGAGTELVLVAQKDQHLVGFACVQIFSSVCYPDPQAELTELYVAPEHRRAGVGRGLVAAAEVRARGAGAFEVFMYADPQNAAALGFYDACGYQGRANTHFSKRL